MASYANLTSLIQLNSHCWDCINSVRAALNRIYGVTSVLVDSAYHTVKVTGKVDPRHVLSVVQSYDIHARLLWTNPGYYQYGYGYNSDADQSCCSSQPISYYGHQPYWGRQQYHPGCIIM